MSQVKFEFFAILFKFKMICTNLAVNLDDKFFSLSCCSLFCQLNFSQQHDDDDANIVM